jgi:hypothetical protein
MCKFEKLHCTINVANSCVGPLTACVSTYIPVLLSGPSRKRMINIVGLQVEVVGQHVTINHVGPAHGAVPA